MATIRRRKRAHAHVWLVDYIDAAGVRRRLPAPTREAAEDLLAEKIRESRQAAPPTTDRDTTLRDYATRWLLDITAALRPRTVAGYSDMLRLYILPPFGAMKLRDLH